MNNKIVFTNSNVAVKFIDKETKTLPANKYLQELEKNLSNDKYGVYFSVNKNAFYITDAGFDFEVILTDKDEESLTTKEYTPLVKNLLYLAAKKRKISDVTNVKLVRETKIKAMDNSNYEDIEDVEDLELYLDYLKNTVLKKAKTKEELETVMTKIVGISLLIKRKTREDDDRIPSPLDLKSYIERFVYDVTNKCNSLERKDQLMILNKTSRVVKDYKKLIDLEQSNKRMLFANKYLPITILDRINEVESFLDRKLELNTNPLQKELMGIMEDLEGLVDNKKTGAK